MKTKCLLSALVVGTSLLTGKVCIADEHHDADEGLEKTLRANLDERHVHVHVHDGIVTLDGKVPTSADRQRIDAMVRNTPGVVALKDKLDVSFPSPANYGANPITAPAAPVTVPAPTETVPAPTVAVPVPTVTVPVYMTPMPAVEPPAAVVTPPIPVVVPAYPKLKVQAWTSADEDEARMIASQLRESAVPAGDMEQVTITVRQGSVSLQGTVDNHAERDALIAAVQRAGGVTAIYDQLHIQ